MLDEANKRCEAGSQAGGQRAAGRQTNSQTDGAGPTSSISWLQEGMAGKMQQNLRGRKKRFRASKIIEEDPETWANKITN